MPTPCCWTLRGPVRAPRRAAARWVRWLAFWLPFWLPVGLLLALPPGQAETLPKDAAAAPTVAASGPTLHITGLRVLGGVAPADAAPVAGLAGSAPAGATGVGLARDAAKPGGADDGHTLVSAAGDLEVQVSRDSYAQAVAHVASHAQRDDTGLRLFLNGVDVSPAAALYAQEGGAAGGPVTLRFHLTDGAATRALWSGQYRAHGITRAADLTVELGWASTGPNSVVDTAKVPRLRVAVASDGRLFGAGTVLLLLALLMWFMIACTDAFRDASPAWLDLAERQRAAWLAIDPGPGGQAAREALLRGILPDYSAANAAACVQEADQARRGGVVTAEQEKRVVVGLVLSDLPLPRPAYSLSRLQLGLWFAFVVGTGLFLWIVYGELPAISGSALVLLGISVTTAGASMAATPDASRVSASLSGGLLADLVTGFDQSHQVHRYQAVVVNLMLLLVGAEFVREELAFPTFDTTWLALLGVSGVAQAAGKQLVETPKAEKDKVVADKAAADAAGKTP